MPLEPVVEFITDLDPNSPVGTENKSQGDDHIRRIKTAVSNLGRHLPALVDEALLISSNAVTPNTCFFSVAPTSPATSATLLLINGENLAPGAMVLLTLANASTPVTITSGTGVNGILLSGSGSFVMNIAGASILLYRQSDNRWREVFRHSGRMGTAATRDVGASQSTHLVTYETTETLYRRITNTIFDDRISIYDTATPLPNGRYRWRADLDRLRLMKSLDATGAFESSTTIVQFSDSDIQLLRPVFYRGTKVPNIQTARFAIPFTGNGMSWDIEHGLNTRPNIVSVYLQNIVADFTYVPGDKAFFPYIGDSGILLMSTQTHLRGRLFSSTWIYNDASNAHVQATAGRWNLVFILGVE